jgi:hypothetical protein
VEDCFSDATEIGRICGFGPICGTCVVYRPASIERGLLAGNCRIRPDRGTFPCTAPICDSYIPRGGAPNAHGEVATERDRLVPVPSTGGVKKPAAPVAPVVRSRPRPVDGPVGVLEMTREELKSLIREAMDEERGGAEVALARKWEGGTVVIKPATGDVQSKEVPVDALLHKVVMIRDRLRVLEQKINAHPKLADAEKVEMQAYVTKCYGSLTTFNVLFRDREDQFQGDKKGDE